MKDEKTSDSTSIVDIMTDVNTSIKKLMESDNWYTTLHDLNIALEQLVRDVEKVNKAIEDGTLSEKNNTDKIARILEDSANRQSHQIQNLIENMRMCIGAVILVLVYIAYAVT